MRAEPTFIIAGERRSGTTALDRWMRAHPDVYLHPHRDMAFFIEQEIVGTTTWRDGEADAERWQRDHTPDDYAARFAGAEGQTAIGEKSADLLFWRPAHARIARFVPDIKLIITLRDPVERAWSHYWNEVGKGRESLSFEDALAAEDERMAASAYARNHLSYRSRGHYADSLTHLFEHVDRARVLIRTLEQAIAAPRADLARIYTFLDVDPSLGLERAGARHNRNRTYTLRPWATRVKPLERLWSRATEAVIVRATQVTAQREAWRHRARAVFHHPARRHVMAAGTRASLRAHYAPHVARLGQLLDRTFPEWPS